MRTAFDLLQNVPIDNMRDVRKIIAHIKGALYEEIVFSPKKIQMNADETAAFFELLERYKRSEPISKIIGKRGFWKYDFYINENTLDPRPETELIIEAILARFSTEENLHFLDIGTGSGCILLSLLSEFKKSEGIGIDASEKAIEVAEKNKKILKITNAVFSTVDWNDVLLHPEIKDIDVIVSNPPYIRSSDIDSLERNVKDYDPLIALDGGADGLEKYREICAVAKNLLQRNEKEKYIFLEIGCNQAQDVGNILMENAFSNVSFAKDLAGIERVAIARAI